MINESKILIVPDNLTIEDALQHEDELLLDDQNLNVEHEPTVLSYLPDDDDDNDFEKMYQLAKNKKTSQTVSLMWVLFSWKR